MNIKTETDEKRIFWKIIQTTITGRRRGLDKAGDVAGLEIRYREGNMAYAPGMTDGSPGQLVIDPDASLSALKHEYQHFLDAQAEGFPSFGKQMFEAPKARAIKELRAYMVEIKEQIDWD